MVSLTVIHFVIPDTFRARAIKIVSTDKRDSQNASSNQPVISITIAIRLVIMKLDIRSNHTNRP